MQVLIRREDKMKRGHVAASACLAMAVFLLGGCVSARPISPTTYAAYSEGLRGSPQLRRTEIRNCVAGVRPTPQQREIFRQLLNLAPGRDPMPVACRRITDAIVSGRLSFADAEKARAGEVTPGLVRILQAR